MLEVEMKFTGVDFASIKRHLTKWGADADLPRREVDHYFNAPDRDFACTDEALRLRRIGQANFVTYKGPKCDPSTKTRTEFEVWLRDGRHAAEEFLQLLVHLGYRPVAVVRKKRRVYRLKRGGFPVEVCLDEVNDLGRFAELEVLASEKRMARARAVLQHLAAELGVTASERRSYLELLLAGRKEGSS